MADDRSANTTESPNGVVSHFASPQRSKDERLHREVEQIVDSPVVSAMLAAADGMLAVLNEHRQVVALNPRLLALLGVEEPWDVLGLRPGEAVGCAHAHDNPAGGCGTGRMCASCGAAIAIVSSLVEDETVERLCCIQTGRQVELSDLFLSVRAHPIRVGDSRWVLLFLQDISDSQNWALLQRVFFHDITNLVTALVGNTFYLEEDLPAGFGERARTLDRYARRLAREVSLQHMLLKAEAGDLDLQPERVRLGDLQAELREVCRHHPAAAGKHLHFDERPPDLELETDPDVLNRVLVNMIVNALEATDEGDEVRVWCERQADLVVFCVSNPGEMPVEIARRIFQRNFSTKGGLGRGLGTYSMKLFGEKLLAGEVDFSSPGTGQTVFSFRLPIERD